MFMAASSVLRNLKTYGRATFSRYFPVSQTRHMIWTFLSEPADRPRAIRGHHRRDAARSAQLPTVITGTGAKLRKCTKAAPEQNMNRSGKALIMANAGQDRHNHALHPSNASCGYHFLHRICYKYHSKQSTYLQQCEAGLLWKHWECIGWGTAASRRLSRLP